MSEHDLLSNRLRPLLSVEEAARITGLSPHTIRAWARTRRMSCRRFGRRMLFHPADLAEFVDGARIPASERHEPAVKGADP